MVKKKLVIFTDLDGTLLDSHYSSAEAMPALRLLKKKNIPLIFCSSKTKTEIEHYRKKLKNRHPFISENGGGIYIPKKYFKFQIACLAGRQAKSKFQIIEQKKYYLIKLGAFYSDLRKALDELRSDGFDIKGFGDMSTKDVSRLTGLNISEAKMAKKRDFDEPFIIPPNPPLVKGGRGGFSYQASLKKLKLRIKSKGFNYTQGKFFHIMGNSDKGRAIEILKKLYARQNRKMITAALGDSPNDIEMLARVDYPIVVQKHDGSYDKKIKMKKLIKADGIGPKGWNRAVMKLLELHGF